MKEKRIIIIDDNEDIFKDFQKILIPRKDDAEFDRLKAEIFGEQKESVPSKGALNRDCNFTLEYAEQGELGYQKIKTAYEAGNPFLVAFVDMRMPPGWDGLKTISHIREVDPEIQVVICSAYSDHSWEDISDRLGVSSDLLILKKPFDGTEIMQIASTLSHKWILNRKTISKLNTLEGIINLQEDELIKVMNAMNASSDAICMVDTGGKFFYQNKAYARLFGYQLEELKDVDQMSLFCDEKVARRFRSQLDSGIKFNEIVEMRTKNNECRSIDLKVDVVQDKNSTIIGYISSNTDVTELLKEREEKRILEEQMLHSAKLVEIGEMAAGVAHEINNPLSIIKLYLGQLTKLIKEKQESGEGINNSADDIAKVIVEVRANVDRISKIIRGLKTFSRDGSDDPFQPTLLEEIFEDTFALCQKGIENKGIRLEVSEIDPELKIDCRNVQICQVVSNLLNNSRDAVEGLDEKWIKVCVDDLGEKVRISIIDSGKGIPEDIADKIMTPFFTTKEVGKGTGLGLGLSHTIISKHKGTLCLDKSYPNTKFDIVLHKKLNGDNGDGKKS